MAYDPFNLVALAKRLGRKLRAGVLVLDDDPLYLSDARERNAVWAAKLWSEYGRRDLHPHGLHYVLISLHEEILLPVAIKQNKAGDVSDVYQNTKACDEFLAEACRDARYMGLIAAGEMTDQRNEEIERPDLVEQVDASVVFVGGLADHSDEPAVEFTVPALSVTAPVILQPYLTILWAEKSSVAHVLRSLKDEYGATVIIGGGDISLTRCEDITRQAVEDGRRVRILVASDFDSGGWNMPVGLARKIERELRDEGHAVDLQVRHVALTCEQCEEYDLPETPMKDGDPKAERFTERWGRQATELDALETLHPGVLRTILVGEIERYFDVDLADNIANAESELQAMLDEHNAEVAEKFADDIAAVNDKKKKLLSAVKAFSKDAKALEKKICDKLDDGAPDVDDVNWPDPFGDGEGDEDDDPLYDSARDEEEQIDRYKEHQGKEDAVDLKEREQGSFACVCQHPDCGKTFTAVRSTARFCSDRCRKMAAYAAKRGTP